jgi:hypothetical protein
LWFQNAFSGSEKTLDSPGWHGLLGPSIMNRLFTLAEYEEAFGDFVYTAIRELMRRKHPLFGKIRMDCSEEIHTAQNTMPLGEIVESTPIRVRMPIAVEFDDAVAGHSDKLIEAIDNAAEEGLKIVMPQIFEQLNRVTAAAGTTSDAKGQPFSWALIRQTVEKMEVEFDKDGKPTFDMHVDPKMLEQLRNSPPTPEENQLWNELLEHKRAEFNARRRSRKLS